MQKVEPVPYDKIDNPADVLDTILNIFNEFDDREGFREIRHKLKYKRLRVSDKDLQIALDKLVEDKVLGVVAGRAKDKETDDQYFLITYQGRLLLKQFSLFIFNKRPYRRQQFMEGIRFSYRVLSFVVTILYSLALGVIAYWSVQVSDKSERLEKLAESQRLRNEQQQRTIDSLNSVLSPGKAKSTEIKK